MDSTNLLHDVIEIKSRFQGLARYVMSRPSMQNDVKAFATFHLIANELSALSETIGNLRPPIESGGGGGASAAAAAAAKRFTSSLPELQLPGCYQDVSDPAIVRCGATAASPSADAIEIDRKRLELLKSAPSLATTSTPSNTTNPGVATPVVSTSSPSVLPLITVPTYAHVASKCAEPVPKAISTKKTATDPAQNLPFGGGSMKCLKCGQYINVISGACR